MTKLCEKWEMFGSLYFFSLSECRHGNICPEENFSEIYFQRIRNTPRTRQKKEEPTKLFGACKMKCLFQSIIEIISIRMLLLLLLFFSFFPQFNSGIEQSNCIEYIGINKHSNGCIRKTHFQSQFISTLTAEQFVQQEIVFRFGSWNLNKNLWISGRAIKRKNKSTHRFQSTKAHDNANVNMVTGNGGTVFYNVH